MAPGHENLGMGHGPLVPGHENLGMGHGPLAPGHENLGMGHVQAWYIHTIFGWMDQGHHSWQACTWPMPRFS